MDRILVKSDELKRVAGNFEGSADKIKGYTDRMLEIIRNLGSTYTGDAASAYYSQFNGLSDDMVRIQNKIHEHVNDLRTIADNYEKAENSIQNANRAMASDVIF